MSCKAVRRTGGWAERVLAGAGGLVTSGRATMSGKRNRRQLIYEEEACQKSGRSSNSSALVKHRDLTYQPKVLLI